MTDQAENLRARIKRQLDGERAKTIAVISGKGGVGKSNFALNFSISLSKHRKKVLLFDLDVGMGNIDLLLGKTAEKTIAHFLTEEYSLDDIIQKNYDIHYIAGGTGLNHAIKLEKDRVEHLLQELKHVLYDYDYLIFDIGAGMNDELVRLLSGIETLIVVVTPEPTSILDAYSAMKIIHLQVPEAKFYLLGNRMKNEKENNTVMKRLQAVMNSFLQKDCEILGFLPEDSTIISAVKNQIPFLLFKPNSNAAKQMRIVTKNYLMKIDSLEQTQKEDHFIERLKHFLLRK